MKIALPVRLKKELEELHQEAARRENTIKDDYEFKTRLALFFQKLIELAEKGELSREETAYLIAGFIFLHFGDELDEITSLAGDLEAGPGPIIPAAKYPQQWKIPKRKIMFYLRNLGEKI